MASFIILPLPQAATDGFKVFSALINGVTENETRVTLYPTAVIAVVVNGLHVVSKSVYLL